MKKGKKFLPFTDHAMFAMIMKDPEMCKVFLQRIFPGKEIKSIKYVEPEKTLFPGVERHSVRLDVLFESDEIYDIELQSTSYSDLIMRSRYYSSALDMTQLKPGESYRNLKPSYVIFLCLFDFFGMDRPIYFFQTYDVESGLKLNDYRYTILLNSKCPKEKTPEDLREIFAYINGKLTDSEDHLLSQNTSDEWVKEVHRRVLEFNKKREVAEIMTLEEDFIVREERAKDEGIEIGLERGREEGREEGRQEGREEGKQETALKLKNMGLSEDIISEATGLTVEEIRKL